MSTVRGAAPGATRICPHCRAKVLESATVCPGCKHHLRFDPGAAKAPSVTPLRVEGTIRHPSGGDAWEYSVLVAIRNDRGEEIARHVVGVGALHANDQRTFSLVVEVYKPVDLRAAGKGGPEAKGGTPAAGSPSVKGAAPVTGSAALERVTPAPGASSARKGTPASGPAAKGGTPPAGSRPAAPKTGDSR